MTDIRDLKELQLDALREVESIGAAHAATALSVMTDRRIMISVPRIQVRRLDDAAALLGAPGDVMAGIMLHMLGDLTGRTLFVFSEPTALRLCDLLLRRPAGHTTSFGELEQSSLKEAGNILCGAYMNALSSFMGMMLLPSVPSLVIDSPASVLNSACLSFGGESDYVFCVETDFSLAAEADTLRGHFLLVPDFASLRAILQAVRLT